MLLPPLLLLLPLLYPGSQSLLDSFFEKQLAALFVVSGSDRSRRFDNMEMPRRRQIFLEFQRALQAMIRK